MNLRTVLVVLVVLVCAEAKTRVKDVEVELGQNITLNCSVEVRKIFWFMKVHSGFLSCISRTFDVDGKDFQYNVFNHVNKFLVRGNQLQVLNITTRDLRTYCCGLKPEGTKVQCKDTYFLKSTGSTPAQNTSTDQQNQDQDQTQSWTQWVVWASLGLNTVLIAVVAVLVLKLLCLMRQKSTHDPSALTNQGPETLDVVQYEEINLPAYRDPPPDSRPSECIYYKAQLPRPSH